MLLILLPTGPESTLEDMFDDGLDELLLSVEEQCTRVSSPDKPSSPTSLYPPPNTPFKVPMPVAQRSTATNPAVDKATVLASRTEQRGRLSHLERPGQSQKRSYTTQITGRGIGSLRAARDLSFGMNRTVPMRRSRSLSPPSFSFFEQTPPNDPTTRTVKQRFPGPAGKLPVISRDQLQTLNQTTNPSRRLFEKVSSTATANSQKRSRMSSFYEGNRAFLKSAPWKLLLGQLGVQLKDKRSLPAQLNIAWIRRFAKRFTTDTIIPILFGVLHSGVNQPSRRSPRLRSETVRVYDGSGTILLGLSPSFLAEYGKLLGAGSAICLTNVNMHT